MPGLIALCRVALSPVAEYLRRYPEILCTWLTDERGEPAEVYSIASGLDYPSVGPLHAILKDSGRAEYICASCEAEPRS